ncbi:hypothetical protein NKH18_01240 [Streptomyces sp. M10(2022)]
MSPRSVSLTSSNSRHPPHRGVEDRLSAVVERRWARVVEEVTPSPIPTDTPALVFPSLRLYLPTRASLATIKPGTLIILRSSWALALRPCALTIALIRKGRTAKGEETTEEDTGKKPTKGKTSKDTKTAKGKARTRASAATPSSAPYSSPEWASPSPWAPGSPPSARP